jgi:hypothetical protein
VDQLADVDMVVKQQFLSPPEIEIWSPAQDYFFPCVYNNQLLSERSAARELLPDHFMPMVENFIVE